ncbi:hypothetical protein NE237_003669 [Protea cynaroides]|uniref:Uncharacterized protein n=1 Tax=Protea cynaroides TaxID=273540 RepID=A0A9Q0QSN2_9MAGN|nr:hypothetical protein NE237_003669 [Protea cynaroides]
MPLKEQTFGTDEHHLKLLSHTNWLVDPSPWLCMCSVRNPLVFHFFFLYTLHLCSSSTSSDSLGMVKGGNWLSRSWVHPNGNYNRFSWHFIEVRTDVKTNFDGLKRNSLMKQVAA